MTQTGAKVRMGRVLDGVAEHMADYPDERTFLLADAPEPSHEEVVAILRETVEPLQRQADGTVESGGEGGHRAARGDLSHRAVAIVGDRGQPS